MNLLIYINIYIIALISDINHTVLRIYILIEDFVMIFLKKTSFIAMLTITSFITAQASELDLENARIIKSLERRIQCERQMKDMYQEEASQFKEKASRLNTLLAETLTELYQAQEDKASIERQRSVSRERYKQQIQKLTTENDRLKNELAQDKQIRVIIPTLAPAFMEKLLNAQARSNIKPLF
jgi:hypothetical protein